MRIVPIKFVPYLKTVLWGGERIAPFKGITTDLHSIGESWELSGVAGHESVVSEGPDKGMTLPELIEKYGADLVGEECLRRYGTTFPLLVKIIDARKDLSVQVHPDDEMAQRRHGLPMGKTEMWYIIDAEPGAKIYAGLSQEITPDDYTRLVGEKCIMDVVASHTAEAGDLFFLPAGRIHAIGAGCLLAEIQQTSDLTYRVYDFDRRDAEGNLRELHTDLAREAIDYKVYPDYKGTYNRMAKGETELVKCPYFDVKKVVCEGSIDIRLDGKSFVIGVCVEGEASIKLDGGETSSISRGETVLIPAAARLLTIDGTATLLTATL